MKKFLFLVISFVLVNVQTLKADTTVTYENADELTKARLHIYLNVYGYDLDSIEDNTLYLSEVKFKDQIYDYVKFFSDAETGGLFEKNSLRLVGANGDGDFWLFGQNWMKKEKIKHVKKISLSKAPQLVKDQLLLWLQVNGQKQVGDTHLTGVFNDDFVTLKKVTYKNEVYDYLKVSVGDGNIAGPLFKEGTLQLEGESSDGSLFLYSQEMFTPSQLPDHEGILHCELNSQYLDLTATFDFDLKNNRLLTYNLGLLGNHPEEDKWIIDWSRTQCEDSTSISFDVEDFKALLAGSEETVWGELKHEESGDLEITGAVECRLNKQ